MKYQKAKMIAKNLPTGSYAAGCPENYNRSEPYRGGRLAYCQDCERTK